jgi:hypothetical protein
MEAIQVRSSSPLEDPVWREARLGVLSHSVKRDGDDYLYTARFPQPVFRGEQVDLRLTAGTTQTVSRDKDRWVYHSKLIEVRLVPPALTIEPQHSAPVKRTVKLPPGADVEKSAASGWKYWWMDYDRRTVLSFEESKEKGSADDIRIEYHLPDSAKQSISGVPATKPTATVTTEPASK